MNTTVKPWIAIDSTEFRRPAEERVGGITVTTSTSPYAVPAAVSAYDNRDNYIFEAKYIGPDEPVQTVFADKIRLDFGKNSKRVVRITLPHEGPLVSSDSFVSAIKTALQAYMEKASGAKDNYKIVMAIVDGNKNRFADPDMVNFTLPTLTLDK